MSTSVIDSVSGRVSFPDGLVFYPSMTVRDLPGNCRAKEYRAGMEGHRMFPCGPHEMDGRRWGVAAIFSSHIDQVWLQLQSEALVGMSLDNEWIRHRWHIDYMRESFQGRHFIPQPGDGIRVDLPWGFVACWVDPRGVQAILQVKYTDGGNER